MEFVRKRQRIDFDNVQIKANGKVYFLEPDLTLNRLFLHNEFELEYSLSEGAAGVFKRFENIFNFSTSGNDLIGNLDKIKAEAHNGMKSLKLFEDLGIDATFRFLSLYLNTDDENIVEWSKSLMKRKIEDWKTTDIPETDFFLLANALSTYSTMVSRMRSEALTSNQKDKFLKSIMEQSSPK